MKARKDEILTIVLFCGFLAIMLVCYLVLPKEDFSETEKRYLAEAPKASWESVSSGQWGADAETYMADHIPGRNFFVGLNAWYDLVSGRQVTKDVRLLPGDRLVEGPIAWSEQAARKNMGSINSFAEGLDIPVDLLLVPSAGWAAQGSAITGLDLSSREEYLDQRIISDIYALAGASLNPVDVTSLLAGRAELYYRTDHHWTSEGVYEVTGAYLEALGRDYPSREAFTIETVEGFRGSTHSRSALWSIPGESLELWHSEAPLTVSNKETVGTHEGPFYRERLEEADKYTVFLDGNHSLVRIENPEQEGKILVIRDSYANAMGAFLAESYGTVVLADLRYYKNPISDLCAEGEFDRVLVCYSLSNFMSDANIIWLR